MGLKSSLPLGMVTCFPPKESIFPPVVITRLLLGVVFLYVSGWRTPQQKPPKVHHGWQPSGGLPPFFRWWVVHQIAGMSPLAPLPWLVLGRLAWRFAVWWNDDMSGQLLDFGGTGGTWKVEKRFFGKEIQVSKNYFQEWSNMKNNIKKDLRFEDLRVSRLVKSYFSPDGVVSFRLKIHQGCQRLLILGGWTRTSWMLQFFGAIQIFRKGEFFSWDCGDPVRHLVFERWSFRNWTSTFVHRCLTFEKNEQILLYIAAFSFCSFQGLQNPDSKGFLFFNQDCHGSCGSFFGQHLSWTTVWTSHPTGKAAVRCFGPGAFFVGLIVTMLGRFCVGYVKVIHRWWFREIPANHLRER